MANTPAGSSLLDRHLGRRKSRKTRTQEILPKTGVTRIALTVGFCGSVEILSELQVQSVV